MPKQKKPEILQAFKWADGVIACASIRCTRREVISWVESFFSKPWPKIKKHGHTIVKVEVKEVTND